MKELNLNIYLEACRWCRIPMPTGGTIHEFLKRSKIKYYPGKVPVYYVEFYHDGQRVVVGGNYRENGRPKIEIFEKLDF